MAQALAGDITGNGVNQGDLAAVLANLRDVVNELQEDHATFRTSVLNIETLIEELHDDHATVKTLTDELKTDYTALLADVTEIRTKLVATHAKLDADGGVTDTNYAATNDPAALTATSIAAAGVATLTAAKPASPPAALTNSTAITLNRG